jgi:hypothetical protein
MDDGWIRIRHHRGHHLARPVTMIAVVTLATIAALSTIATIATTDTLATLATLATTATMVAAITVVTILPAPSWPGLARTTVPRPQHPLPRQCVVFHRRYGPR